MNLTSFFARSTGYGAIRAIRNGTIAFILSLSAAPLIAAAEPVTIVALGDSLTAGYGLPPEDGFVPQMQAWLAASGADAVVLNAGVSGDTTAGGASRLDWALTPDVDALIVNLGGNDMLRGIDPGEARGNLTAIMEGASARGLPVLLVGLRAPGNYGADYKAAFDAIYPDLSGQFGAGLVADYLAPVVTPDGTQLDPALMQPDGIHPNKDGVAAAVAAMGPAVLDLIGRVGG
ncbi:MAG: GDSL-type esterase/lipase family protein [Paracoccaceae bacterium]